MRVAVFAAVLGSLAFGLCDDACAETPIAEDAATPAADGIAGLSVGGDLLVDASVLLKRYVLADGSDAWSSGAGAGARTTLSLHFRGPADVEVDGRANWLDFELGIGAGVHSGFWKALGSASTAVVDGEVPIVVGVHYGLGHMRPTRADPGWSGLVLGVAWAPTYVFYVVRGGAPSKGELNPAGLELTVDRGSLRANGRGPMIRFVLGWLPDVGHLPTTIDAGVGCAFY